VIRRVFYLSVGATLGVMAFRRLTSIADAMQPDHVARRVAGGARGFALEVRSGMREREHELRTALGLDAGRPSVGTGDHEDR
jgi:hypothetical protein